MTRLLLLIEVSQYGGRILTVRKLVAISSRLRLHFLTGYTRTFCVRALYFITYARATVSRKINDSLTCRHDRYFYIYCYFYILFTENCIEFIVNEFLNFQCKRRHVCMCVRAYCRKELTNSVETYCMYVHRLHIL